jgi:hypothetical protein
MTDGTPVLVPDKFKVSPGKDDGPLDNILQLPYVAGVVMLYQNISCLPRESFDSFLVPNAVLL